MRTYQLRIYEMRTREVLDFYRAVIYPRHLNSFPLFGIEAHGFWTAKDDIKPRLFVLVSYAPGANPDEVGQRYMKSKEFADDIRSFDPSDIVHVESTTLMPSQGSPLN